MWIAYMGKVMKNVEEQPLTMPEGIVQTRINPESGLRESDGRGGIMEYFYQEFLPAERDGDSAPGTAAPGGSKPVDDVKSQLF